MITIISGTNRPGSNTLKLAKHVEEIYQSLEEETTLIDLGAMPAELYLPEAYKEKPEAFIPYRDSVLNARGLVVLVPEYNGSYPGALKYFIDMLPFPQAFENRCVAFIGIAAGQWAGLRPVEHMQGVFGYRNALIYPKRAFFGSAYELFDGEGELQDMDVHDRLENQAKGFLEFVSALKD